MGNCVTAKGPKKDPKRLTDEEIKLLLDNTRLTRPQIIALHQNFLKECPTGKLTKKDFIKLFKEVHPSENKKEKADKFCEYVFKVIDQQNLGYITFQEFVLCFSLTSDGEFKDKCEFAFKLYDLDKDGKISKKEMTQVLEALYDLSGITDRKGDKSPAKKVEDIIKAINAKSALQAIEGSSPIVISSPSLSIAPAAANDGQVSIQQLSKPAESNSANTSVVLSTPSATIDAGEYGKLSAPVLTVSTTSAEDKKKAEKEAKKEKKAEKPKKEEKVKVKETKEEKAAKKEKDKQEKERLKQEKEKEKKEKAERAKLEKEQKEREKKEKAELKKLDKSVKADKSVSKPAKAEKAPKEAKQPKGSKPSKPEKIEYITKDQFIEACSTDEGLRQLFVDSIFCANPDATISATLGETVAAKASEVISAAANSVNAKLPSIKTSKIVTLSTTTTSITTNNNNNETTITTEKAELKEELPAAEPSSNEPKQINTLEEIIDDLKNQININVNNEKVEINASS